MAKLSTFKPRAVRQAGQSRPIPPDRVAVSAEKGEGIFLPSRDLDRWARDVFMDERSPLYSETHADVVSARIGWLWTSEERVRSGNGVLGEASLAIPPNGVSGWDAAMYRYQLAEWFGEWWRDDADEGEILLPHFKIVLYAPWFATASNVDALALVKHELLHCRQAVDAGGEPRFNVKTEEPVWGMRGHDVEVFYEEVEWFGGGAMGGAVDRLADLARRGPRAGQAAIDGACGTCQRKRAA